MPRMGRVDCVTGVVLLALAGSLAVPARASAAWLTLQTPHFTVIGDANARDLRDVALRFEQFRESITTIVPAFADDDHPTPPVVVIVFKDQRSYEPFQPRFNGRPVKVGGYYVGGRDVNYITIAADGRGPDFEAVYHEFTHLLVERFIPGLPPWFDEGIAEFFSTFDVAGTSARIGEPRRDHWRTVTRAPMSFAELFAVTHESAAYNEGQRRSLFYAQSWLLAHYALIGKPERFEQLLKFHTRLTEGASTAAAFQDAFGFDVRTLETEVAQYARRPALVYRTVTLGQRATSRVDAQPMPLPEPEAQAWLGDLLIHAGRPVEARERLLDALNASPDLPMAHASLGMMLLREKKPVEAIAHLERAIASSAANEFVYFNYGMSIFERAGRSVPGTAEVRKAIAALVRATERRRGFTEAERLLGYSYLLVVENEKGRDVLQRALDEEPGDEHVALQLAAAELALGRIGAARRLLNAVATRSSDPDNTQRARDLLARAAGIEERQTVRREAGLPDAPAWSGSVLMTVQPAFRSRQTGENRTYGVFTEIECTQAGAVIHLKPAGRAPLLVRAPGLDAVAFISYRQPTRIACGRQNPPQEIYLTWQPNGGAGDRAAVQGTAVAVELLPEGYVPVAP